MESISEKLIFTQFPSSFIVDYLNLSPFIGAPKPILDQGIVNVLIDFKYLDHSLKVATMFNIIVLRKKSPL